MALDTALWRATAAARLASLAYAAVSAAFAADEWVRPDLAVLVLAGLAVWSLVVTLLLARPSGRRTSVVLVDLLVACAAVLVSGPVQGRAAVEAGTPTLTLTLGAVPVIAWAVHRGAAGGAAAAVAVCAATLVRRGAVDRPTVGSCVLLLLLGAVVGYVVQLGRAAEQAHADAVARQTATAERERLAREVHDGVLQALALVARRGDAELAALAAQQEARLRRLLTTAPPELPAGTADLRALLPPTGAGLEVAAPASPVLLPAAAADLVAAAVRACLDNVAQHADGRAFVLVEDEGDAVLVTVRDDGPGIPVGRLEEAAAQGRMGLARSVRGRVEELGGTVRVVSVPGQGTEVELRVPRPQVS